MRAGPAASQVEAGNFAMLRGAWNQLFLEELEAFPLGTKDDQVDALSRAFTLLTELGPPSRRLALPIMAR
jgi:predicted phage terminase large subunit-like protein